MRGALLADPITVETFAFRRAVSVETTTFASRIIWCVAIIVADRFEAVGTARRAMRFEQDGVGDGLAQRCQGMGSDRHRRGGDQGSAPSLDGATFRECRRLRRGRGIGRCRGRGRRRGGGIGGGDAPTLGLVLRIVLPLAAPVVVVRPLASRAL